MSEQKSSENRLIENPSNSEPDNTPPKQLDYADMLYFESDFQNFINSQITHLIELERVKNPKMLRVDELEIAIDYCKKYLVDTSTSDEQKKQDVMAMLVDLKLEMEQHKVDEKLYIKKFVGSLLGKYYDWQGT